MLALVTGLMTAALPPSSSTSAAVCEAGRAALRDLPAANRDPNSDSYYSTAPDRRDLLNECPKLRNELPIPLADEDARARATIHVPSPVHNPRPAFIYRIDIPKLSDGLTTAVVRFEYSCTGLCGGIFEAHYVRTSKGWQRQGEIRMLVVS